MKPCINLFNSYHQGAFHPKTGSQAAPVAATMPYPLVWPPYSFPLGVVVIILFVAALSFYQIDGFSGEYDEGAHVMVAWLMSRGFSLYTEIASAQLPLLYQPTAWVFALFGPSLVLARWVEIGYALLGIVVVAGLGRRLWRPAVGLWAALFLSLEYYWFYNSRMPIGSVAAAATGGLAVWCALNYYRRGDRRWLARAGLVYSFSLLIKPLALFVGLLFPVLILARWRRSAPALTGNGLWLPLIPWPNLALDCLYLGMGALLLPALSLVFYHHFRTSDCPGLEIVRVIGGADVPKTLLNALLLLGRSFQGLFSRRSRRFLYGLGGLTDFAVQGTIRAFDQFMLDVKQVR